MIQWTKRDPKVWTCVSFGYVTGYNNINLSLNLTSSNTDSAGAWKRCKTPDLETNGPSIRKFVDPSNSCNLGILIMSSSSCNFCHALVCGPLFWARHVSNLFGRGSLSLSLWSLDLWFHNCFLKHGMYEIQTFNPPLAKCYLKYLLLHTWRQSCGQKGQIKHVILSGSVASWSLFESALSLTSPVSFRIRFIL